MISIFEYLPLPVVRETIRSNRNTLLMIHRHITSRIKFIFRTRASLLYYTRDGGIDAVHPMNRGFGGDHPRKLLYFSKRPRMTYTFI